MKDKLYDILIHKDCCGCGACVNVCPVDAIDMNPDSEGFLYPLISDDICIHCNKCVKICPILNITNIKQMSHNLAVFAGHLNDYHKLKSVTSGGAATAISEKIIKSGGVVFGVTWSNDFRSAYHRSAKTIDELEKFRGSRYIQSDKRFVYREVKETLQTGCEVLFIGLPCEVAALKSFLQVDYSNLFTAELICHAVTSNKVAEDYLDYMESEHSGNPITYFSPRYTGDSWNKVYMRAEFANGDAYQKEFFQTEYGMAFMIFSRPSCYNCKYKGDSRVADITLGDFWGMPKRHSAYNRYGVSNIFVHTEKGKRLVQRLDGFSLYDSDLEHALLSQPLVSKSTKLSPNRNLFADVLKKEGLFAACKNTGFKTFVRKQKIMGILKYILFNWTPFKIQVFVIKYLYH